MTALRIGMAGLDTSHVTAFATLLHDTSHEFHVPGARISTAFGGGSPDFDLSMTRVGRFTDELRDKHGVEIVDSISAMRGKCDAIMLESIDGRIHLPQFREVAGWGIPVFIDKPLTISRVEAQEIAKIALEKRVRVSSASALRFSQAFRKALNASEDPVIGADLHGPMPFQEKCPGYFWYGIHAAEMLFASMGRGCRSVQAFREEHHDVVVGRWRDGRLGVMRGNRTGKSSFGGLIHRASQTSSFDVSSDEKPFYTSLLEQVISFFRGECELVRLEETVEVIGFLEAANNSAATKEPVIF